MKIAVINTTQRKGSYSLSVSNSIVDVLLKDGIDANFNQIEVEGFSKQYLTGRFDDTYNLVAQCSKIIFVVPSYYKNLPPMFMEWLCQLSKPQFEVLDMKPILIVSTQAGFSIDSLPETTARNTICQAIRFSGSLADFYSDWIGVTKEKEDIESLSKLKDRVIEFSRNYKK
jgi:NAD(P)H-dependent FMN reductase